MKRFLEHLAFWTIYTLQDALLEMVWMAPALKDYSPESQWWISVHIVMALNIPKLLIAYFVMYVTVTKVINEEGKLWWNITQACIVAVFSVVLYRVIFNYYVLPIAAHNTLAVKPLFELSRTLLAVMDIGFGAGVAIALRLARIQLAGKEREKNLLREKHSTELKYLRNQTNPHFLFNTLNNIYALARKKSDETAEVVMKLSKILRFMLYETSKDQIMLSQEIKMLDDYLELEKIRYNERLTITFDKDIDDESQPVSPLLLLPFVENAFKHGVSETRFNSYVYIALTLRDGMLTFTIENTKEDNGSDEVTDSIGLSNVRRQLQLMYADHTLEVYCKPTTFKVHLTINLNSHANLSLYHSGR
ncbi:histidine kinase [Pseudoflavitalea sp. G-6-1-2]|uniref:sensor histidine kinase n=1 Tax=Pseudoflavitalea sp. G-6-1-2 TaxID=2728841 RepID=UPI00146AF51D|nr:histidine kinase [Pseudoflavitalea sp. G-6-1-2]NML23132.1 histidine kinase [Pseudoflavitalea sp. G-6-1-2]